MRTLVLLSAAVLAATPALAADQVGQWYLTPQVGGISTDNDRLLEDKDWLYGFSFGRHFSPAWTAELNINRTQMLENASGTGGLKMIARSADVLRVFNRDSRFSPYITVGAGELETNRTSGPTANDFMAQAGLGAIVTLWENEGASFSLRPEIKARWDDAGAPGYLLDYIGTLGLQWSFGRVPVVAAAPPPPPPVVAAPPPPPPPPPPPADSDNDGVLDDVDRCPGTPAGTLVDAFGCPQRGSIILQGVSFEFNSAQLTADSRPILARVASDLKKYPRLRVEMQGHTDSVGSDQYNLGLSQQRANSVREFLISEGVPAERVTARGYGEAQPVADNKTAEGRARNRRVVMSVVDNPGDVRVEGEGVVR